MIYLRLFFEFFKTGLFAIGGGLATIPFLSEMSAKTGWFTTQELTNMIAISESTPGPTGINMATYVGFTVAGLPGSIIATLGEITPSVIIIILVSKAMSKYKDNKYVSYAMVGIRACSIGLLSNAALTVIMSALLQIDIFKQTNSFINIFNIKAIIIFVITYLLNKKTKLHPALYLLIAAVIGVIIF